MLGAVLALFSAFQMSDHVRLVEIIQLFFGGVGTGVGLGGLIAQRRRAAAASAD